MSQFKDVLVAGEGQTPAVLTNTVWALAHEKEPVVPDEIVVITTATARKCIDSLLLTGGGGIGCVANYRMTALILRGSWLLERRTQSVF